MNLEKYQKIFLNYLSNLSEFRNFENIKDLAQIPSRELLELAANLDDSMMGLFLQMLKSSGQGQQLFQKLMGEHDEENRILVDSFFERYMSTTLADGELNYYNPLSIYLPRKVLDDLVFVQSRRPFFLRQAIATINEYFQQMFGGGPGFAADEQRAAWSWFWDKVSTTTNDGN